LDALRGFDMFFIVGGSVLIKAIAELFPSGFSTFVSTQMGHVAWHGFAFYDMIFPLFLFIAGVSFPFSFEKSTAAGVTKLQFMRKIFIRALKLFLLGLVINKALNLDFENIRYASVLGRIGIAWMLGAIIYMYGEKKWAAISTGIILLGYYFLAAFVPSPDAPAGASIFSAEGSIICWFDVQYLPGLVLDKTYDPEGILSTIPAIATALLGILTGVFLKSQKFTQNRKVLILLAVSVVLTGIGLLWNEIFPINKKMWTSSYVCFAGGLSLFLLTIFYWIIDVLKYEKWAFFFRVIGLNSITIYVAQRVFNFHHATGFLFNGFIRLFGETYSEALYAFFYLVVIWVFMYFLYRKNIFLKV
jgi:predicted acyltransferase